MTTDERGEGTIAFIQPFVPNYRRPLFDAIEVELAQHGLRLEVWHDEPTGRVAARGNAVSGSWSVPIKQHRLYLGRKKVTFRPVGGQARKVRAVVTGLASTNLETYGLALDPSVQLMLWGHGRNFTARNNAIDNTLEGWLCSRAKHIFTYTEDGKRHVVGRGLPDDRVSVVFNSTDTNFLRTAKDTTDESTITRFVESFELQGKRVALFVGALDEPKKLPFLFEAVDIVHSQNPDIVLLVAGAGPDEASVRAMAEGRDFIRFIGRLDAKSLAEISHLAEMVLMPGRVGLVAVDALALGLPVITTNYPYHAPEAAYLTDGLDSVWTEFDVEDYAREVSSLLHDDSRLHDLAKNAANTGMKLSVQSSAQKFADGILAGLT